jgi:hypothetical protein
MYGVPNESQLRRLIGQEFNFIGLGRFQIQFHISSLVAIYAEGRWELHDASGTLVDSEQAHAERDAFRIHRIIDIPITRFSITAPRSFTLFFESGHALTLYDEPHAEDSLSLHFIGDQNL